MRLRARRGARSGARLRLVSSRRGDPELARVRFVALAPRWAEGLLEHAIDDELVDEYVGRAIDLASALCERGAPELALLPLESVLADLDHAVAAGAITGAGERGRRALGSALSRLVSELVSIAIRRRDRTSLEATPERGRRILERAFEAQWPPKGGDRERRCRALLARAAEAERLGMRRAARALVRDAAALEVTTDRRLACEIAASMLRYGVSVADLDD